MSVHGGRHLDGVWYYFTRCVDVRGNIKATCKGCGLESSGIVSRMWRHVDKCGDLVRVGLLDATEDQMSVDDPSTPSGSDSPGSFASSSSTTSVASMDLVQSPVATKRARYQALLEPIRTGGDLKRQLDEQLCKCVPSCSTSS